MSNRRDFLLAAGIAALAVAPAGCSQSAPSSTPVEELPDLHFDNAKFEAILKKPARHRQCFAATELQGGAVLDFMSRSIEAYSAGLGEGSRSLHAAAVVYHGDSV